MRIRQAFLAATLSVVLMLGGHGAGAFYKGEGSIRTDPGLTRDESNRKYFTDLPVVSHEGRQGRFYTDFLKDRVVLVTFFYVNCPTADPEMGKLDKIRKALGEELGDRIYIVALTADPERDSLEAIREHARKYRPGKGWLFLTGSPEAIRTINYKFGNISPYPESHIRLFLLGNLRTGRWMKLNQYAPSASVVEGLLLLAGE
jgi:protein SCO1/2